MVEPEHWNILHEAGVVRGVKVAVCAKPGSAEYYVQLLDSFEDISDIGETFVGKGALRRALECADITWNPEPV